MGDVGDFGKFGLLRALCAEELTWGKRTFDLSLGVSDEQRRYAVERGLARPEMLREEELGG